MDDIKYQFFDMLIEYDNIVAYHKIGILKAE
jgi:hypothetical protein